MIRWHRHRWLWSSGSGGSTGAVAGGGGTAGSSGSTGVGTFMALSGSSSGTTSGSSSGSTIVLARSSSADPSGGLEQSLQRHPTKQHRLRSYQRQYQPARTIRLSVQQRFHPAVLSFERFPGRTRRNWCRHHRRFVLRFSVRNRGCRFGHPGTFHLSSFLSRIRLPGFSP